MQVTIARQLGLEPSTVGNFFMNARRRSMDKWKDDNEISSKGMNMGGGGGNGGCVTPPGGLSAIGGGNNSAQMMATLQQSPTTVATTVVHMPQMGHMNQGEMSNNMVGGHCLDEQDL